MTFILAVLFAISTEPGRVRAANRPQLPAPAAVAVDGEWSLEITTSGGIAGRGFGHLHADSSGKIAVSNNLAGAKCESTMTPQEIADVAALVKSLRADQWYSSYIPSDPRQTCCDMFFVTVKVQRQERTQFGQVQTVIYSTQFINEQTLPVARDLRALVHQLWSAAEPQSLYNKYLVTCRN